MSMADSSSSSSSWKYDVFLNFRGEDTRKIFVGHLYSALRRRAINTFIDAEELRKGNDLSELLAAIESSRLSIVVFSPDYASSTWCLKELVKILACMDAKKQIVVPIFYQVDPSEVRKLKRSFAEAFPQNEGESSAEMKEVESWRSALARAANLSGWVSQKYEDDAKLIEEIVDDIFEKLNEISSSKANGLIGMDSHMRKMHLLLYPDPPGLHKDDVRIVGIWGMGGLGKTTIASAVYHEIAREFEACCFLENVKEGFKNNGKLHMQTQLLASISNNKVVSSDISSKGFEVMLKSLGQRKVLIVVDDVDKLDQIDALLGNQRSFGGGSRIIITTRDSTLLSEADAMYKPQIFSDFEALELFRKHAFRTIQPTRNYGQLSRRVIQYAQGLPLALKVLGAHLHNKTVRQWEDVLEKIRKIPQSGIHDVLKTSFDGLDETEKKIFLDIACFFKGMKKDRATAILDSFGFYPHDGIGVLIDRALISVSVWGVLEMHDLLEEMGREIVRQEFIEEPGRRSRLWSYEDVRHVLTQNTATEAVEGIILGSAIVKERCSNTEAFVSMTKLRLLMIRDDGHIYINRFGHQTPSDSFIEHWIADLKFQCSQLRCLIWRGCPLKSWPSNFQFKNLVNLDMSNSCIEQLWKGAEGNLQSLSLFMYLPGSKLSDWYSHQCSGSSVTVHLPPVSDHKILGFAVCGVTKFKYAHYTSNLSALCFCTFRGEHGQRSLRFKLLHWITFSSTLNVPADDRLLESDHMFMGYLPLKIGVQFSERYTTEATFRVELEDSWPPVQQHRIRRCGVRLFYANHEEVHNQSMTQPDFRHEYSEVDLHALSISPFISGSWVGFAHPNKRNREGCCYNEAEQSGGETPDAEDLQSKRLVLPDGAKEN